MEAFVYVGGGFFFVLTSVVGVRLLLLARRNRGTPEWLLGLAFVLGGTLGGALGQYVQLRASAHAPALMGGLMLAYVAFGVAGITLYNAFSWRVFRPDARWAAALVAAVAVHGLVLLGWCAASGVFATGAMSEAQHLTYILGNAVGPLWATLEALRYHRRMRRRQALGLADPLVTNRFALFGLASGCAAVIVLCSLPPALLGADHPLARAALPAIGSLGCVAATAYALAFFPPARYRAWLGEAAA